MLNDLAGLVAPELTIMDAVVGMEGEGPSNGKPREFNYLLASTSPYYLDLAAVKILGIEPEEKVPSIKAALEDNIIKKESLEIKGDQIIAVKAVEIPKIEKENNLLDARMPEFLSDILEKFLRPKPVFKEDKCVGCRTCAENCPPDAITMIDNFPEVNLDKCIRCFCCQELCPYDAVDIKYPLLAKWFFSN
jgi:heterodisulfide reductase subunit A-like polyferredoxin